MLTRPIEEDASAHDPDVGKTMRTKRAHTMQVDQQPRAVRGAKNIRRRTCDIDRGSEVTREGGTTKSPYWRCSGNLPPQTQVYFGGKFGHGHWHNTSRAITALSYPHQPPQLCRASMARSSVLPTSIIDTATTHHLCNAIRRYGSLLLGATQRLHASATQIGASMS